MRFNRHSELEGRHAYFSPSKPAWTNYDEDKMARVYASALAARRGDELHAFAAEAIRLNMKLEALGRTLDLYVNDAIGFKMSPEQRLFYSNNFFGTADSICFRNETLRIHDLKTGVGVTTMRQLETYAALFCLEYGVRPFEITTELRIYQNDQVKIYVADPDDIFHIMERIVTFDKIMDEMDREELGL